MMSTRSSRPLVKFDVEDVLRTLISLCRPAFELSRKPEDAVSQIASYCSDSVPVNLGVARIFEWRVPVFAAICYPGSRNPLTETLMCNEGETFLVRDPGLPQNKGVFLCRAGADLETVVRWAQYASPLRMFLGERQGIRLMAVPLDSYFGNAKETGQVVD